MKWTFCSVAPIRTQHARAARPESSWSRWRGCSCLSAVPSASTYRSARVLPGDAAIQQAEGIRAAGGAVSINSLRPE